MLAKWCHLHLLKIGTILVFLPGKGEIEQLQRTLLQHPQLGNRAKSSILQLHSNLSPNEQYKAFQPVKYGQVKIILSTNVAETSITISDVTNVSKLGLSIPNKLFTN